MGLQVNDCLKSSLGWMPARIALALMAWFGFINLYMTRINMAVIIVAMVKTNKNASDSVLAPCQLTNNMTSSSSNEWTSSTKTTPTDLSASAAASQKADNSSLLLLADEGDYFDWDETIQGFILGSFYYGYLVTQIPGGRLAERYGTKWVFGGCILGGGICALLSPIAARTHYGTFIALRILHGLIQGVSWPSMHALLSKWIPPLERPRFIATVYFGNTLSTALTLPMCGLIIDRHGWPAAFYITGTLSIVWCLVWFTFMYDYPAQHPRISPQEREYIEMSLKKSGTSSTQTRCIPWRAIFTSLPMWAIIIGDFGNNWTIGLFFTQLPTYMKNILGFSIKENGLISALPFLSRYVGAITLSSLADWLIGQGHLSIRSTRRIFSTLAMWVPAIMLLGVAYAGCGWLAIVILFCVALFFNGAVTASILVNHTDIAPNFSGTLFGITNATSTIAAFLVPVVTGILTDGQQTLGQWQKVFWICVPMYIVMHILFFIFCSGDLQPWNFPQQIQQSNTRNRKTSWTSDTKHEEELVRLNQRESTLKVPA